MNSKVRLAAEWEPQDAVLLCWPHRDTLWRPYLAAIERVYVDIVRAIARDQKVLLIARKDTRAAAKLLRAGVKSRNILFYDIDTNDTWARDYGPISVQAGAVPVLRDFRFNGWGRKYRFARDNLATRRLHRVGAFGSTVRQSSDFILEGGSIESDGEGTILTTTACLMCPNRNPEYSRRSIEAVLRHELGASRILWLNHGALQGDDTNSHIDTLARFVDSRTIVYTACDDSSDPHYADLRAMADDLRGFRRADGHPYRLVPLPWPKACYDAGRARLPASYANFLITNSSILMPTYGGGADRLAHRLLAGLFKGRQVIDIDCSTVIRQHGAVHCLSMQIPRGVLP